MEIQNFSLKYSYLLYGTETRISSSTDGPLGSYADMTFIVELFKFFSIVGLSSTFSTACDEKSSALSTSQSLHQASCVYFSTQEWLVIIWWKYCSFWKPTCILPVINCNSSLRKADQFLAFCLAIFQHNEEDWNQTGGLKVIAGFCCFYPGVSMTPTTRLLYCFKESPAEVNDCMCKCQSADHEVYENLQPMLQ